LDEKKDSPTPEHRQPADESPPADQADYLAIGRITRPHGVRGEVRVAVYTDLPERFTWLKSVFVGEENPRAVGVEKVRLHKDQVILKLAGYESRDGAETLRGQLLQVLEGEAIPLEEGEYFLYQLVGLAVYSDEGEHLGELVDLLETRANTVFVVKGPRGEILLPDTAEVVQEIDFESGRMTVHLLPGLLP
jgi:16S rRNA processing protein RimM